MPTSWAFQSATDLATAIRNRGVSASDLLEYFLGRVDRYNDKVNAIVVDDRERARQRATEADEALERGDVWGPLHGVPMTIKDSYDVAGLPSTHGVPEMADNIPEQDALSVERLKAAGVVLFGKTNVPHRLADFQSYNDIYGTTNNPYDLSRTPGGSSGGSAAALAAGLTGFESGSDIGGSIRNPAHFCGVFGHKPTWNLLPPRGHAPPGVLTPSDISVIGPMARSAADLELGLHAMAGPNEIESRGFKLNLGRSKKPVGEWKVAAWATDEMAPVCSETQARVHKAARAFEAAGAAVSDSARPDFSPAESHETYHRLLQPVMAGRLSDAEFTKLVEEAEAMAPDDKSARALVRKSQTARHRDWLQANERRTQMRWAWHRFFEEWDVVLCPVMATSGFKHDHSAFGKRQVQVDGKPRPYFEQVFWSGLTGVSLLPSTVVPTGLDDQGLPIGIQIVGPEYSDLDTIHAAAFLEGEGFAFTPPEGYED